MGIAEDITAEHGRIVETMVGVGPDASAGVEGWTVADLAAHLDSQRAGRGIPVFLGRFAIARGVQLGKVTGGTTERTVAFYRRHGFARAIDDLRAGVPPVLLRASVAPVSLFEVWLHHDDVRRANGLSRPPDPESLGQAVDFARRYQRRALAGTSIDRSASNGDLLRWLAGRPSPLPPHAPPLRF